MRKGIKIFLSFISTIILLVIVIPVVSTILISSYSIQNFVVRRLTDHFSEKLGTTVSIDRVGIKLFNRVTLDGFYVEDMQGDTLLYAGHLDVGFRGYNPWTGVFRLGDVKVGGADFRLAQDSTGKTNLKYITEQLRREKPPERKPFILRAQSLTVDSTRFRLQRYVVRERPGAINFADMDIRDISLRFDNIGLVDDSIHAQIEHLSAREKSGFALHEFSGKDVRVWKQGIRISDFRMRDDDSEVSMPVLNFDYPRWNAFNTYVEAVDMHAEIRDSKVAMRTIGWFAPRLASWRSVARLDGTVDGTVSALSGVLDEVTVGDTRLDTRFAITGLPDIDHTRFSFDIRELSTDAAGASEILRDITGKELGNTGRILDRLEGMTLTGTFDGLLTDFLADGTLQAAPGGVDFHVRLNPEEGGRTHLDGNVSLAEFEVGRLLAVDNLGSATLTARLNGFLEKDSLMLVTDAAIGHVNFNGYDYRDIHVDGEIRNSYYKGLVASDDPNLDLRLDGTFDFNAEIPQYDFHLALDRADLHALNLNRRDSVSVLRADVRINAQGTTLDDITGHGTISGLTYYFPGDTLRSQNIILFGDNLSPQKRIRFNSDFLDAELTSRSNVVDLLPYVRQTLQYYLPSLDSIGSAPELRLKERADSLRIPEAQNYYALQLDVKEKGEFASALLPGLYVAPGTNVSLLFNPSIRNFSAILRSDLIEYNNIYIANLEATNRNQADSIALYLRTDEVGIGNFYMPGLTVHGGIRNNVLNLSSGFSNPLNGMSAMINTVSELRADTVGRKTAWHSRFTASRIRIGEQEWRITSPEIVWGGDAIDVNQFRILTTGQEFLLDGRVSREPGDTLHLSMSNFDLSPLSGLIDRYGYGVTGRTNGRADLIAGLGDALFYGRIAFEDVRFNDKPVQNSTFISEWDPAEERIRMSLVLASGETILNGGYRPDDQRYYVNANIPNIDLALLTPVLKGVLTDIEGTANADVVLMGVGGRPSLNGQITVPDFAGTVDFTRARYRFSDAVIKVEDNNLILPKTTVYDGEGGEGDLEMTLRTRYFSQLSYDLKVAVRRMLALNTTVQDNDYFYGKAYASGTVGIRGDRRAIQMDMNVTTEDNSTFFMPLTGASSIAEADFIVFEDPDAPLEDESLPRYRLMQLLRERQRNNPTQSDLNINMVINVRPNTEVQLVIDPKIGDIIKANGTGTLTLNLRPREDIFTMFGDYQINEGNYLFTLMNIFNKRFTIEPGSSIQWVGDPVDAILNVTATYRVRASTAPITGDNRVVPVDCKILLSDRLSQPTINFDIVLPNADADLRNALQNAMNTQELKSQQFVWLWMSGTFYGGGNDNIGTATTATTGIEFLTNQLSNWLSTERFNLNFGYTLGSEQMQTSDEVEGMFSGELIPNKLLFEGEVNYNLATNNADPRNNQFSGDFYLTYIIDRMGSLRAKVFSRTIDRYDENQGLQEQGVGIYYKQDFDRWRDLFRRSRRKPGPASDESPPDERTDGEEPEAAGDGG